MIINLFSQLFQTSPKTSRYGLIITASMQHRIHVNLRNSGHKAIVYEDQTSVAVLPDLQAGLQDL